MKYRIEFELPDNETVFKEIETEPIKWSIWGYSGYAYASAIARDAQETLKSLQCAVDQMRWERDVAIDQLKEIGKGLGEKMDDIVELLKDQEPVRPEIEHQNEIDCMYRCGACGCHFFMRKQKCCQNCGRAIKWYE